MKGIPVTSMPAPNYITVDSTMTVDGNWRAIGVSYDFDLIEKLSMFGAELNDISSLPDDAELVFDSTEILQGFTALVNGEDLMSNNETQIKITSRLKDDSKRLVSALTSTLLSPQSLGPFLAENESSVLRLLGRGELPVVHQRVQDRLYPPGPEADRVRVRAHHQLWRDF